MNKEKFTRNEAILNSFVVMAILYTALESPLTFAFKTQLRLWQVVLDVLLSLLFVTDLVVSVRKYRLKRKMRSVTSSELTRNAFIAQVAIDIISSIPFDFIFYIFGVNSTARSLKLLRLLRLVRIVKIWNLMNSLSKVPKTFKIALVSTCSLTIVHWFTCLWITLHPLEHAMNPIDYYIKCFYWAVTTLTTVGYGDITPQTSIARIYTMFVMFIGIGIYGFVIGSISRIFAESSRYKEKTRERLSELRHFMDYYHVPNDLQTTIFDYYQHIYTKKLSENDKKIINELPQTLKGELQIYMNMKLIRNLPVLKNCSHECLKEVANALEQSFYGPGDSIISIGDIGDEMFIIGHGSVDLTLDDNTLITRLYEGAFFGEVALLKETTRNANAIAASYTDLYRLSKESFIEIIKKYPILLKNIEEVTK